MGDDGRRVAPLLAALLIWAAGPGFCDAHNLPAMILKNARLTAEGSPHRLVRDTLIMKDAVVTCEPGTVIEAPAGVMLVVYGKLVAAKTTFRPIKREKGPVERWGGIQFLGATAGGSKLTECTLEGAGNGSEGALYFTGEASALVSRCEISGSASDGIVCMNASPVLEGNTVRECLGAAVRLREFGHPTFTSAHRYEANGVDGTVLEWDAAPNVDCTLCRAAQPYHIPRVLLVRAGQKLTIEPGVDLLFGSQTQGLITYGVLSARGTAEAPIEFRPAGGSWGGIEFRGGGSSRSVLTHCRIRKAGGWAGGAAILFSGATGEVPQPTLRSCYVIESHGDGLRSNLGAPLLDNCAVRGCAGHAVVLAFGGTVDFATPLTAEGNGSNTVNFDRGGYAVTTPQRWKNCGLPYVGDGPITVLGGGSVEVDPGVELRLARGAHLAAAGGPIKALGTETQPIIFRGLPDSATGEWGGLMIQTGGAGSTFCHCVVRRGGAEGTAQLLAIATASVTVENCSFSDGAGPGMHLQDSVADISDTAILRHSGAGVAATGASQVTLARCRIRENGGGGVHIAGGATLTLTPANVLTANGKYEVVNNSPRTVQARGNWWGCAAANQIALRIFDHCDNLSLGAVVFEPFLVSPPQGAASERNAAVPLGAGSSQ